MSGLSLMSLGQCPSRCWFWLFLLVIFLPALLVNSIRDVSSEWGNCRFDLTSISTFSCVLQNDLGQAPSLTCCQSLLYAINIVPPDGESGACCLCRYVKEKYPYSKLLAAYVTCKGKDIQEVKKWASVPRTCSRVCPKRNSSSRNRGTSAPVVNVTGEKTLGIVAVFALVLGLVCYLCYRRCQQAANPNEKQP